MDEDVRTDRPIGRTRRLTPEEALRLEGLTPREAEVALLAARGLHVCAVARQLQLAPGTVKSYLARAREKLGCRDVRELSAVLLRNRVIQPEDLVGPREGPEGERRPAM